VASGVYVDPVQGTFIVHGADGRGGRTTVLRPNSTQANDLYAAASAGGGLHSFIFQLNLSRV